MRVRFTHKEGAPSVQDMPFEVAGFHTAELVLLDWRHSAPDGGAYDKIRFELITECGDVCYSGRYDLQRDGWPALRQHVLSYLDWIERHLEDPSSNWHKRVIKNHDPGELASIRAMVEASQ